MMEFNQYFTAGHRKKRGTMYEIVHFFDPVMPFKVEDTHFDDKEKMEAYINQARESAIITGSKNAPQLTGMRSSKGQSAPALNVIGATPTGAKAKSQYISAQARTLYDQLLVWMAQV